MGLLEEAARLFGWQIKRPADEELPSFTPKDQDDGAVTVASGGRYGTYVDLDGSVRSEAQLVTKYRDMAVHPEVDSAINQITNEAIVQEDGQEIVELILDEFADEKNVQEDDNRPQMKLSTKKLITAEFDKVLELLQFNTYAYDIFRKFYVDGRMYYHVMIDDKAPADGIKEVRYIDPRKIRKVREVAPLPLDKDLKTIPGATDVVMQTKNEYFVFNPNGFNSNNNPAYQYSTPASGMRIANDAIVHITSGITDSAGTLVLGYLHKAIKPLNQLRALEDAAIIYRLARAPERRIFYIEVGDLPKIKAEQYIRDMMQKYKNRLVYDAETGAIRDDRKFMTMLEDFWFPRRNGQSGTQIDVLPPGNATGVMEEVEFFKTKLYAALNVPYSRTNPEAMFSLGPRMTEVTRDEVTFSKFIDRCRLRFNMLFLGLLEKQLILKGIILPEEWEVIRYRMKFRYAKDNLFAEIKEREILNDRMNTLNLMTPYIGKFYPVEWIRKNVLRQTDEDIEEMDAKMAEEMANPLYQQIYMGGMMGQDGGGMMQGGPLGMPMPGLPPPPQGAESLNKSKKSKDKKE